MYYDFAHTPKKQTENNSNLAEKIIAAITISLLLVLLIPRVANLLSPEHKTENLLTDKIKIQLDVTKSAVFAALK